MPGYTESFASNNMLSFATFIISFFFSTKKTNKFSRKLGIVDLLPVSGVGFEPTPTIVDQNTSPTLGTLLKSGAFDRSANLTNKRTCIVFYLSLRI